MRCPICLMQPIEKGEGCNWLPCPNLACGVGLCWATRQLRAACGGGHNCH